MIADGEKHVKILLDGGKVKVEGYPRVIGLALSLFTTVTRELLVISRKSSAP